MILASIDTYLSNRLKKIKVNNKAATVYGPGDARSFGETSFPCFAISRISPLTVDMDLYNHYLDVFTASSTNHTVEVPDISIYKEWIAEHGSNQITGPESWTVKKFPIPVTIDLQIDILAAILSDRDYLELGLMEAVPSFHRVTLDGQSIIISEDESPVLLDDLDAPLFRTAHRYSVRNIWVQRTASRDVASIVETDVDFGVTEEIGDNG